MQIINKIKTDNLLKLVIAIINDFKNKLIKVYY